MTSRVVMRSISVVLFAAGVMVCGEQVYMLAKAQLARLLLERSFALHLRDSQTHRPWPWADLAPIARLDVPRLGESRLVLNSAAGSAMAFGLGSIDGTARPGSHGNVVLAGHRDSWAGFVGDLRPGDVLQLTTRLGVRRYRLTERRVVDKTDVDTLGAAQGDRLTLITCYPIDGMLPTRQRLIATATSDSAALQLSPRFGLESARPKETTWKFR